MPSSEFDELYGGKWFKSADLQAKTTEWLPIRKVEKKQFDGEARPKYVLHFDAPWKPLVLNKTNAGAIAEALGKNPSDWIGATIGLYKTKTQMDGRMVDCVRIEMPDAPSHEDEEDMNTPAPIATPQAKAPGRRGAPAAAGLAAMPDDKPWERGNK